MLLWVHNLGFAGSEYVSGSVDPNEFGSLPSVSLTKKEPPAVLRRKRNRRFRYLTNDG